MQFASGVLYQSGHEVVLEGVGDDDVDEDDLDDDEIDGADLDDTDGSDYASSGDR